LGKIGMQSGEPIEHRMLSNAIEKAQKRVEDRNFEIRKHLLDYDDVLNEQRNFLYRERDAILTSDGLVERVRELTHQMIEEEVTEIFARTKDPKEQAKLLADVTRTLMLTSTPFEGAFTKDAVIAHLGGSADREIDEKLKITGNAPLNEFLRFNYLRQIDIRWQNHLVALEDLRDAVGLRSYAQKNPLVEYKVEGFEIFTRMLDAIGLFIVQTLQRVKITPQKEPYRRAPARHKVVESHSQQLAFTHEGPLPAKENRVATVRRDGPKVGRNDPCPCGSGKKYKHCHGA
ncbi:MAG: preprotein translocase subunit SecA, partial [Spirochaetales bacterium]|nr:preprotein translocase subunit SecA [Spirochaetales bacterium]